MKWFLLVSAGVAGGLLGGMGLGGGTLLMPILTFILGVPMELAAWLNLVSFLPAAAVALMIHVKSGLISWREVGYFLLFVLVGAALVYLSAPHFSERLMRRSFGILLIVFGAISAFVILFGFFRKKS